MGETTKSLVLCPDCGNQISPSAASCPQCGRPMTSASNDKAWRFKNAVRGFTISFAVGGLAAGGACRPDNAVQGMYVIVVALFFGAVGAGVGVAIGGLRR